MFGLDFRVRVDLACLRAWVIQFELRSLRRTQGVDVGAHRLHQRVLGLHSAAREQPGMLRIESGQGLVQMRHGLPLAPGVRQVRLTHGLEQRLHGARKTRKVGVASGQRNAAQRMGRTQGCVELQVWALAGDQCTAQVGEAVARLFQENVLQRDDGCET